MPVPIGAQEQGSAAAAQQGTAPRILVPFLRSTHRHQEPAFDVTFTPGASSVNLGPFDVPAHGFIRSILLWVTGTGGALGGGALTADAPFTAIRQAFLHDTNGYPVIFPVTGYQLYLLNAFGGYRGFPNPVLLAGYDGTINMQFWLRLPVEITPWDGFGALSNQSASSPFRVSLIGATLADLITGGAPTAPAVRIRGFLESYDPVAETDMLGNPQETAPPGHGTTQYWSVATPTVSAQRQQVRHTRVGNLIRNLIYVFRTAAGARDATVEPDDFTLLWDSRLVFSNKQTLVHKAEISEVYGFAAPLGVIVLPFTDDQDGQAGFENRHLWVPTVESTRLEFEGTFGAAGVMEILTNDVGVTALGR